MTNRPAASTLHRFNSSTIQPWQQPPSKSGGAMLKAARFATTPRTYPREWSSSTPCTTSNGRRRTTSPAAGQADHHRTDEGVPACERPDHRCLLEFSGKEEDQEI